MAHSELGIKILNRFVEDLADLAVLEQEPERMGRSMAIVLSPRTAEKKGKAGKSVKLFFTNKSLSDVYTALII